MKKKCASQRKRVWIFSCGRGKKKKKKKLGAAEREEGGEKWKGAGVGKKKKTHANSLKNSECTCITG